MAIPPPPPMMGENGGNHFETRKENSTFLVVMNVVNTLTHMCLGAITIGAIVYANLLFDYSVFLRSSSLHQHIYLCVIGYIVLMSQAIMTMSPYNGWAGMLKYQQKKTMHWIMQVCGSMLAITGSCIRIADVESHFSSAHGALGIIALIFTFLSLIGGIVNLFSSNIKVDPKLIRIGHSCIGSLTMICAFLCLIFGFDTNLYRGAIYTTNSNMLIALTVLALLGILTAACLSLIRRFK